MNRIRVRILLVIILSFLVNCEKNDKYNNDGEVSFYTNAQALLNCGNFDIYVYIDGKKIGTLSQPIPILATDKQPICGDPLTLTIKKQIGEYVYSAEGECGYDDFKWEGDFQILKDSCTKIFLDLLEIIGN